MSDTRQFNVRIPDDARDVLTRIATRLREDDKFVARLTAFMDTLDDPTADDSLAERVARIEARLDAMGGASSPNLGEQVHGQVGQAHDTPSDNLSDRMNTLHRQLGGTEGTPPLTTGEGRGRRLTTAGEIEVERRIEAGDDDSTIAAALGVSANTVRARRRKIGERLL